MTLQKKKRTLSALISGSIMLFVILVAIIVYQITGIVQKYNEIKRLDEEIYKIQAEIDELNAKLDKIAELTKPVITSNPLSKVAKIGEKAQFGVVAVGVGISYQWQYLGSDGKTWYNVTASDYSGLKSKTMTVPVTSKRNGLTFRFKVFNASGTVYSTSAKLTAKA